MNRYILNAGTVRLSVAGEELREEVWVGIETDTAVNLEEYSRRGYDLVPEPARGFTHDELASVGVTHFEPIALR